MLSFKAVNFLGSYIKNNQSKSKKQEKSDVCKLTCNDCPIFCVG